MLKLRGIKVHNWDKEEIGFAVSIGGGLGFLFRIRKKGAAVEIPLIGLSYGFA